MTQSASVEATSSQSIERRIVARRSERAWASRSRSVGVLRRPGSPDSPGCPDTPVLMAATPAAWLLTSWLPPGGRGAAVGADVRQLRRRLPVRQGGGPSEAVDGLPDLAGGRCGHLATLAGLR